MREGKVSLLTVEFFIGTGREGREQLYVNELAPRVHNSAHVAGRSTCQRGARFPKSSMSICMASARRG